MSDQVDYRLMKNSAGSKPNSYPPVSSAWWTQMDVLQELCNYVSNVVTPASFSTPRQAEPVSFGFTDSGMHSLSRLRLEGGTLYEGRYRLS